MDYFLIIVLGIVVLSVWNSSRDTSERLREAVDRLEREIEFLRSQVAALTRDNAKPNESPATPVVSVGTAPQAAQQPPRPAEPAQATHSVAPPVAAYKPVIRSADLT